MKPIKRFHHRRTSYTLTVVMALITALVSSCSFDADSLLIASPTPVPPPLTSTQNLPQAMVAFEVTVPSDAPAGAIGLELLDEVTGLALNPQRYTLVEEDAGLYSIEMPLPIRSVIKYRYLHQGQSLAIEHTASGSQVRYRMAVIEGPMVIQDTVAAWTNFRYNGPTGRVRGQVAAAGSNTPVSAALVVCGGSRTLTASDGSFLLEGIMPGTHNLVVYSLDGAFHPFQQGARVAENASTPAFIQVTPTSKVNITFVVKIPETNIEGLPVRMVGNITDLGNTFADLEGGLSVVASRAPLMSEVSKGIYSLTLELPEGLDLRYKYTLGDGFWNAEHTIDGLFRVRQLIVPGSDHTQTDVVDTWKSGEAAPIIFSLTVPENTPRDDTISIQFNPFIWTTPIPMWPLGGNRWVYVLYSPLDMVTNAGYRYCRNDQCGSADDLATRGLSAAGHPFTAGADEQTIQDQVQEWAWWSTTLPPTTIIAPEIKPRDGYIAGIEFSRNYSPTWQPYYQKGIQNAQSLGANWALLTPTWRYTRLTPPVIESVPGQDQLWQDVRQSIQTAQQAGLKVGVFPRLTETQPGSVWPEPIYDTGWWLNWFDRYRTFVLNFADLAEQTGAPMLVLGGREVLPALPGGMAMNGEPSGVPPEALENWFSLLLDVRDRYHGQLAWALPYPDGMDTLPEWIGEVDLIYVLFSAPLANSPSPAEGDLQLAFGDLLDQDLLPIFEQFEKPLMIGINYPSADGSATACIPTEDACLEFDQLSQPMADLPGVSLDLDEQASVYGAVFNAVSQRDWISGLFSRGFYLPAALQDKSSSVHGKPAADIIWYWFPKLIGQ